MVTKVDLPCRNVQVVSFSSSPNPARFQNKGTDLIIQKRLQQALRRPRSPTSLPLITPHRVETVNRTRPVLLDTGEHVVHVIREHAAGVEHGLDQTGYGFDGHFFGVGVGVPL